MSDHKRLLKRAHTILEAAHNSAPTQSGRDRIEAMQVHVGYSEPGYGTLEGDDIIVTGNFNEIRNTELYSSAERGRHSFGDGTPGRVAEVLEKAGISIEWSDEWATCCECQRLVRTQADSYGWTPSFTRDEEYSYTCVECLEDNPEEHLQTLEGQADKANTLNGIHPEEHNYICLGEFERGFHRGQDDDPRLVGRALEEMGLERWLFNIDSVGQFDARFSLWLHEDELTERNINREELEDILDRKAVGPSVSEALKRAFEDADQKMRDLPSDGIKYAKLNEDGTADVKSVSAEDFIEGNL
jgi:hypothetical protein